MTVYEDCPWPSVKPNIIRFCPRCRKRTEHTAHGFRMNNYRETCDKCGKENYGEFSL